MGALEEGGGGAAILRQPPQLRFRKMFLEKLKSPTGSSTKPVNALIGITHCEHISRAPGKLLQHFDLGKVRVLKFIDQNELGPGALPLQQLRIFHQQFIGTENHMAKGAQITLPQHALHGFENRCDFAAAAQGFFIGNLVNVFGPDDPGNGKLAALDPMHIFRVLPRPDQFILAAAHEFKQVVEKLGYVGRAYKMIQLQLADVLPQKDPQLLVIEHTKTAPGADEQVVAIGVECRNLQALSTGTAQLLPSALQHFFGGVVGVSQRKDFIRTGMPLPDQVSDPADEDCRLSRARTRYCQHWPSYMLDSLLLLWVRLDGRAGFRLGNSH